MTRARSILSPLTLTLLLFTACDHARRGPLGPIDVIEQTDETQTTQVNRFVKPVELELEWALGNPKILAEQPSEVFARIRVKAPDELDLPPPPARVVLVVDTSASMKGDAIVGAKRAAEELVDTMREGDQFALVVFHSESQVLIPLTIIDDESRAAAKAKIDAMQAWGTTDLAGGLSSAVTLFDQPWAQPTYDANGYPIPAPVVTPLDRIVLLGDGVPNDRAPIDGLIDAAIARRVVVTTLGYGLEFDETVLAKLAQRTGGHYHFVEQPDAVAAMFRDEVLDIQRTVAQDIRLAFALGPDVTLLEVVGYAVGWNPNTGRYELPIGTLAEGQDTELLVRLAVGPRRDRATVELLDLSLDFIDIQTGTGARSEREFLAAEATTDKDAIATAENREIVLAAAHARTAAATLLVFQLARGGDLAGAKAKLDESVKWAREEATRLNDESLRKQADELAALKKELAGLVPRNDAPIAAGGVAPMPDEAYRPTAASARAVREAHSSAFNELHD
ncbi:vWA domain-containing protein [Nannocystaceae bacterium ST9]